MNEKKSNYQLMGVAAEVLEELNKQGFADDEKKKVLGLAAGLLEASPEFEKVFANMNIKPPPKGAKLG